MANPTEAERLQAKADEFDRKVMAALVLRWPYPKDRTPERILAVCEQFRPTDTPIFGR